MEDDMNDEYKGHRVTAWPERDDTTGPWNAVSAFSMTRAQLRTKALQIQLMMKTRRMKPRVQRPGLGSMSNSGSRTYSSRVYIREFLLVTRKPDGTIKK
jgi:hypothetical protein